MRVCVCVCFDGVAEGSGIRSALEVAFKSPEAARVRLPHLLRHGSALSLTAADLECQTSAIDCITAPFRTELEQSENRARLIKSSMICQFWLLVLLSPRPETVWRWLIIEGIFKFAELRSSNSQRRALEFQLFIKILRKKRERAFLSLYSCCFKEKKI